MRNYKFTVQCKSGAVKVYEFQAQDYRRARMMLEVFIANN